MIWKNVKDCFHQFDHNLYDSCSWFGYPCALWFRATFAGDCRMFVVGLLVAMREPHRIWIHSACIACTHCFSPSRSADIHSMQFTLHGKNSSSRGRTLVRRTIRPSWPKWLRPQCPCPPWPPAHRHFIVHAVCIVQCFACFQFPFSSRNETIFPGPGQRPPRHGCDRGIGRAEAQLSQAAST